MNKPEEPSPQTNLILSTFKKIAGLFAPNKADEIHDLVQQAAEEDGAEQLTEHERRLITAALKFDDVVAEDVATSRENIIAIQAGDTFQAVWEKFTESRHSRLPVRGENLDDIQGFVALKDVLPFVKNTKKFKLKSLTRPITFVPESMEMPQVLHHMRKCRASIAIVVDEYGGTDGLITLKDVLEQLVGELNDEDEKIKPNQITLLAPNHYRIHARLRLDVLKEQLGKKGESFLTFAEEPGFDTVGGFALHLAGRVPHVGDKIALPHKKGYLLVTSCNRRKVDVLELKLK